MSKHVINGKIFDTEKATVVAHYSYSHPGDFHYVSETLYKSPKGTFFIVGEGGPMTTYARKVDTNTWSGGEGTRVLTKREALQWCEEHGVDAETILREFADLLDEG